MRPAWAEQLLLKLQLHQAKIFCPARAERNFLRHSVSPCWGCPPNPQHGLFFRPCRSRRWGRLRPRPQTPAGPIFSYGRKDGKRPFKGAPAPLKIPRWGALWPRPQTPRPGNFVVGSSVSRAKRCALNTGKIPLFVKALTLSYNCPASCFAYFGRERFGNLAV